MGVFLPLFHPWPIAVAYCSIEAPVKGIVLGAYAWNVVAAYIFDIITLRRLHLIIQNSDIGNVLSVLVLVIAGSIEADHK
ncbi:hypothetical protein BER92_10905 [Xanthomonas fragariae]|nr:hypothetical protein BER92_10905 [Xanthomonas fragariae]